MLFLAGAISCFNGRVRDAPLTSAISKLRGQCITLKQPMFIVDGRDGDTVNAYLAPSQNTANSGVRVAAGDQFIIDRTVLKRTFDGRYSIIAGHCKTKRVDRKIWLFLLFNQEWITRAERAAFADDPKEGPVSARDALFAERARWCE